MAYISLAGKRDTETAVAENKQLISDSDYDRVAYWGIKTFFPDGVIGADGETRQPTGDEVFKAITDAVYAQIKRDTEALFLREAEDAARQSVQPIELTPSA